LTPPLHTRRLLLRPFCQIDADFVIALVNDPAWLRFIGDRGVRTVEQAEGYIARMTAMHAEYRHGGMRVALKETGEPIGMAGLFRRPGLEGVDIGFALMPSHHGRGYAHEAAEAVLADGRERLGLRRVGGVTVAQNVASIRLLEKLGLRYERTMRLPEGTEDVQIFAREW
jgi:RimJ/RimL family protein N-acetyltransferase